MVKKSEMLIRAWNFVSKRSLCTRLRQVLVRTIGILTVADRCRFLLMCLSGTWTIAIASSSSYAHTRVCSPLFPRNSSFHSIPWVFNCMDDHDVDRYTRNTPIIDPLPVATLTQICYRLCHRSPNPLHRSDVGVHCHFALSSANGYVSASLEYGV